MDEVIALEKEITAAIREDRVPDSILPFARDVLLHSHTGPGTRLARLQTIASEIRLFNAARQSSEAQS